MATATQDQAILPEADRLAVRLISGLFLVLGGGAILIDVFNIIDAISAREAGEVFGTTLLRFLNIYGIVLPVMLLLFGIYLIRLSARLFNRDAAAASWGRQILIWLIIAVSVIGIQSSTGSAPAASASRGADLSSGLTFIVTLGNAIPWLIVGIAMGAALYWMNNNFDVFVGKETLSQTSARIAWNLLVPTMLVLVVVALRPLEATFVASLTDARFASSEEPSFVGLDNYSRLLGFRFDTLDCERGGDGACVVNDDGEAEYPRLRDVVEGYRDARYRDVSTIQMGESQLIFSARDEDFLASIGNTMQFTVASVTLELLLGLFIAMVINSNFRGRGLMRAAMLVPWAIPTVVSARLWETMLRDNQSGVINNFLVNYTPFLSESQAWLANPDWQIWAMVFVDVWKTTPFMALILLAGLQTIPSDIYEAADVDGANKIRQFISLTLPLLRPTFAVALVFRTLDAVRAFDVFQVLLGQTRYSMASYNFFTLTGNQESGYASAIGVVIFVIILLFTAAYVKILGVSAE